MSGDTQEVRRGLLCVPAPETRHEHEFGPQEWPVGARGGPDRLPAGPPNGSSRAAGFAHIHPCNSHANHLSHRSSCHRRPFGYPWLGSNDCGAPQCRAFFSAIRARTISRRALGDWLADNGWDDVFLDLDPDRGIAAGERWERALHAAATRCEAVVFLSRAWLASGWCPKEYELARGLNKKLFAALIDPGKTIADLPPALTGDWQIVDLTGGQDLRLFATTPGSHEEKHVGFASKGCCG